MILVGKDCGICKTRRMPWDKAPYDMVFFFFFFRFIENVSLILTRQRFQEISLMLIMGYCMSRQLYEYSAKAD